MFMLLPELLHESFFIGSIYTAIQMHNALMVDVGHFQKQRDAIDTFYGHRQVNATIIYFYFSLASCVQKNYALSTRPPLSAISFICWYGQWLGIERVTLQRKMGQT